ncbi:hypothetical protein DL96DRAFT_154591 [Flagelloscypha sp. PMI_526]|nr:hypothetical protein DL96DRAFT_154591 [Flagelloscypha sp. PMI_526]
MRFSFVALVLFVVAGQVFAQTTFSVLVGSNNALTFSPESVNEAKVGDIISFSFMSGSHSLTQSTFATPCQPFENGVDSGVQPVAASSSQIPQFSFQINNATRPLWFYCKTGTHCSQSGMVFAVNPTTEQPFADFKAAAVGGSGSSSASSASPTTSSSPSTASSSSTSSSTPSTSASGQSKGSSSVSPAGIAGIVVGIIGSILLLMVGLWLLRRHRIRAQRDLAAVEQQDFINGYAASLPTALDSKLREVTKARFSRTWSQYPSCYIISHSDS